MVLIEITTPADKLGDIKEFITTIEGELNKYPDSRSTYTVYFNYEMAEPMRNKIISFYTQAGWEVVCTVYSYRTVFTFKNK